jgi:hypothetical protein
MLNPGSGKGRELEAEKLAAVFRTLGREACPDAGHGFGDRVPMRRGCLSARPYAPELHGAYGGALPDRRLHGAGCAGEEDGDIHARARRAEFVQRAAAGISAGHINWTTWAGGGFARSSSETFERSGEQNGTLVPAAHSSITDYHFAACIGIHRRDELAPVRSPLHLIRITW